MYFVNKLQKILPYTTMLIVTSDTFNRKRRSSCCIIWRSRYYAMLHLYGNISKIFVL